MVVFLKFIKQWTTLKVTNEDDIQYLKLESDWSKDEDGTQSLLSMSFTMELTKICSGSLILAPISKKLGRPSIMHMKAPSKFACEEYNSSLPNLKFDVE